MRTTSKYAQCILYLFYSSRDKNRDTTLGSYEPPVFHSTTEAIAPYILLGVEVTGPLWDISGSAGLGASALVEIAPKDNKEKMIIK